MKHLIAEFTAKPGCRRKVEALLADLTRQVRIEPGNVTFDPYVRADRLRSFVVVEAYLDEAAFEDHLSSPHCRDFNTKLVDLIEGSGSNLVWLTPCDPTQVPQVG